jgi:hypothetical protein
LRRSNQIVDHVASEHHDIECLARPYASGGIDAAHRLERDAMIRAGFEPGDEIGEQATGRHR